MLKTFKTIVSATALVTGLFGAASAQVVLSPGNQAGAAGDTVEFAFAVSGEQAAQTAVARFRLALDPATAVIEPVLKDAATGEVDCTIATDLAGFVTTGPVFYQPNNKRVVIGFGDFAAPVQAFGRDGTILSCKFKIKDGTAGGTYPLACSGAPTASTAAGAAITSSCADGVLTVSGGAVEPTPTATLPSNPVVLSPGNHTFPSSAVGTVVTLPFPVLGPSAGQVAVARFRLALDPATSVLEPVLKDATTGEVDCTIAEDLASFVTTGPVFYQPNNKRVVIGFGDFAAPVQAFGRDGVILSCKFTIKAGTADGQYVLDCSGAPTASSAAGAALDSACVAGALNIGEGGPVADTPTPSPTASETPTTVPTNTPTNTVQAVPSNTPTKVPATRTPTHTAKPSGGQEDEDGCQISTTSSNAGWMWLIPAVGFVLIRRKRR